MRRSSGVMCSNCAKTAKIVSDSVYRFKESGLKNVFLVGINTIRCPHCKNIDPIIPNLNGLMQTLAAAVAGKPYRLCGDEIRYLRKYLRMNGEQFANLLAADKTSLSKWENDDDVPGERTDRLIRAVTVGLGEGLQDHIAEIVRGFASIKGALTEKFLKNLKYKLDPEKRTCEYA